MSAITIWTLCKCVLTWTILCGNIVWNTVWIIALNWVLWHLYCVEPVRKFKIYWYTVIDCVCTTLELCKAVVVLSSAEEFVVKLIELAYFRISMQLFYNSQRVTLAYTMLYMSVLDEWLIEVWKLICCISVGQWPENLWTTRSVWVEFILLFGVSTVFRNNIVVAIVNYLSVLCWQSIFLDWT